jgi:hypothetical protein
MNDVEMSVNYISREHLDTPNKTQHTDLTNAVLNKFSKSTRVYDIGPLFDRTLPDGESDADGVD